MDRVRRWALGKRLGSRQAAEGVVGSVAAVGAVRRLGAGRHARRGWLGHRPLCGAGRGGPGLDGRTGLPLSRFNRTVVGALVNVAVSLLFVALASNLLVMLGYAPILPVASTEGFRHNRQAGAVTAAM